MTVNERRARMNRFRSPHRRRNPWSDNDADGDASDLARRAIAQARRNDADTDPSGFARRALAQAQAQAQALARRTPTMPTRRPQSPLQRAWRRIKAAMSFGRARSPIMPM